MIFRYSIIILMLMGLTGCASNNKVDFVSQASQSNAQTIEQLMEKIMAKRKLTGSEQNLAPTYLTDLVNVPELNQYLQVAFKNNPSLQQSITALKIAYAQQGVTVADQLPTFNANFSGENQKDSDVSYSTDLTVSWELDLWQKLADSSAAARKDVAASQASLEATKNLLAANIMRAWLGISINKQLLDIEQRRLTVLENNESLILKRYQTGLNSLEDLDNAKTNAAYTRSTIAQYQENLAKSERDLVLLTGQWDSTSNKPPVPSQFPLVINSLDSLSQQNMAGRPDLQQAFFNIEAESYRTDAAYKAMLPSFSLSASLLDIAKTPSEALLTNPLWSLLGQISAPLFQGGKLKSQAEMAELTTEQSYWEYQEALLNAVNEVENAVGQEYALTQQEKHLNDALTSAKRSVVSYEQKYREGLVDIFDLLTVEEQTYDIKAELANATYQRLLNRIDLGLALGLGVSL